MAVSEEHGEKLSAPVRAALSKYLASKARSTEEVAHIACIVARLIQSKRLNNREIVAISGEPVYFVWDVRIVIHYVLRPKPWSNEKIYKEVFDLSIPIIQSIREELTCYIQ